MRKATLVLAALILGAFGAAAPAGHAHAGFSSLKICHFPWVNNPGTYLRVFEPYGADNWIFLDKDECTVVNDSDNGVRIYIYAHSFRWRPTGGFAWSGCYNNAPGTFDVGNTWDNVQYRTFKYDGCPGDH